MILKSIKLENIRSYRNAEINFPEGSILLSGDIGSGKSTVLMAVEFALFGIKSDISGHNLLRHSEKNGSVELEFDIEEHGKKDNILVKRFLKKGKSGITQEAGWMIKNGIKTELTPVELKSKIFEILGYPQELLTKSKSLIYRYTIYTPQEQMKEILTSNPEDRINILRKIFGIDKYKRIKDNCEIYAKELKNRIKEKLLLSEGIGEKESILEQEKNKCSQIKIKIGEKELKISLLGKSIQIKKDIIGQLQKKINAVNESKKNFEVNTAKLWEKEKNLERNSIESAKLIKEIETSIKREEELKNLIKAKEEQISGAEEKKKQLDELQLLLKEAEKIKKENEELKKSIEENSLQANRLEIGVENSEKVIIKINDLSTCPTCMQEVNESHKHETSERENAKIQEKKSRLKEFLEAKTEMQKKYEMLKKMIEEAGKNEVSAERTRQEIKFAEMTKKEIAEKKQELENNILLRQEKNNALTEKKQYSENIENEIQALKKSSEELKIILKSIENIEQEYQKENVEYEKIRHEERNESILLASMQKEHENLALGMKKTETEIEAKKKIRKEADKIMQQKNWLEEFFINTATAIEKEVMKKIYLEFNELFRSWFSMLIEDEMLNARLDESFSVVIEQNGYESSVENLSGGEKTAVALAYRLALNKVINDLVSSIKTKNIIILDEPTDGFSTEQLDRVREVLAQLKTKQAIIVSHESKIESFVDNVIRLEKKEHESYVVQN